VGFVISFGPADIVALSRFAYQLDLIWLADHACSP
jgi:hypothetical protein